ncbi:MAG: hypothetical protein ACI8QZ_000860 [Chlamydiales bacterium]|jgi:hypothetical protein
MRILRARLNRANAHERGVALLISFLVLLVVIALVYQIHIVTSTDSKVSHNDITRTRMDLAIESAFLQVYESLADDGEGEGAGEGGGAGDAPAGDAGAPGLGGPGGGGEQESVDSKMDDWARPQVTSINEIDLRIMIQDEESKYNILNMLNPDEELAELAFERVSRILDRCREDTRVDIDGSDAQAMARVMLEHLSQRSDSGILPRPLLMTDDLSEDGDLGMPLSLREFAVLEPFNERHFKDFFDADGVRVHSIESFLTIWTSAQVGPIAPVERDNQGAPVGDQRVILGYGVNVNTAPLAVLASLTDTRDVNYRFWDGIVEYRNIEAELEEDEEELLDPMLDENGEEILQRQFFEDLETLEDIYGWINMDPAIREEVEELLTLQSHVFSIYISARLPTQAEDQRIETFYSREERETYERSGLNLVRTVRSIVWRNPEAAEMGVIPLLRWEVLDYQPFEVLDYPDDNQ